jgi:hypothetical protein
MRWPRFLRRRPRRWIFRGWDEAAEFDPQDGGLTWDQFSDPMRAVEAQATEPPRFLTVLPASLQDDAASGKLEP